MYTVLFKSLGSVILFKEMYTLIQHGCIISKVTVK